VSTGVYDLAVTRALPVLGFLVAVTLLAELSERAGVFEAAAHACARLGGGSTVRLYLLVAALGTLSTIVLSLDSTAVLLTPVVLTLATRLSLSPMPFAFLAVWLANTASLLLPVSNLTNLLAVDTLAPLGIGNATDFAARMWLPEIAAVGVSVGWLALLHRGELRGRYVTPVRQPVADRVLFTVCAAGCCALAPAVLLGVPPWQVASPAAAVALLGFLLRRRDSLQLSLIPWRLVVVTEVLFVAVALAGRHGLDRLLGRLVGCGGSLRMAGLGAVTSNLVNNLPAYLGLERVVPARADDVFGLLLGTNAGPLVLLWGSLATLLWRRACVQRGVRIGWRRFALTGLGGVPLVLLASWGALQLTG
jgi:arsenical pump membrane protein